MIGSTLKQLLQQQNINVSELSRRSGVSAQTIYSIVKRDNMKIDFDVLTKLCAALEVPVQTFCPEGVGPGSPTLRETELIKKFRSLDDRGKALVEAVVKQELESMKAEKKNK